MIVVTHTQNLFDVELLTVGVSGLQNKTGNGYRDRVKDVFGICNLILHKCAFI